MTNFYNEILKNKGKFLKKQSKISDLITYQRCANNIHQNKKYNIFNRK